MTEHTCTRFHADGTACSNQTDRRDGWCGQCPGYTTARPCIPAERRPRTKRSEWQDTTVRPLDPEEAYEIGVPHGPLDAFVRTHGGTRTQAETQIRSLLEDLLRDGRVQTDPEGCWRLTSPLQYELLLSKDAAAVIHYRTKHRERTYAQVKAGVESRVSTKKERRTAKWLAEKAARATQGEAA